MTKWEPDRIAQRMAKADQRAKQCRFDPGHAWHVIYDQGLNYPCGGGTNPVKVKGTAS